MRNSSQRESSTADQQFGEFASPPSLNLPKGGGAIRGIDEKLSVNPASGTAGLSLPIPISRGRSGFSPDLTLTYDSGNGNGPFGLGWALSIPSVSRKTSKGLPRYRTSPIRTPSSCRTSRIWFRF